MFDFDGTLVDSNAIKRECFFEIVKDDPKGHLIMKNVLAETKADRSIVFAEYCRIRGDGQSRSEAMLERFSELVNQRVAEASEMPGSVDFLDSLKSSSAMVVLSSATPLHDLIDVLKRRNWIAKFDRVFGAPRKKAQTIENCLLPLVESAKDIAVVGDGEDDLASALETGCAFFPVGEARGFKENGGQGDIFDFQMLRQQYL